MLNSKDSFREMQKSCDEDAVAKDRATGQALIRRDSAHEKHKRGVEQRPAVLPRRCAMEAASSSPKRKGECDQHSH